MKGTPLGARQIKIDNKTVIVQEKQKAGAPPSDTMKQNVVPTKQLKIPGPDSGPAGAMAPGTDRPTR
jgi:hypothetical protein